jgi:methylmalonyl-CoA/ethylmalonyl-CoA epimerase
LTEIDHIGIAVESLDEALKLYRDELGLEHTGTEEVPTEHVRVAFLSAGSTRVELLEPTDDSSPIARHLKQRGPGIHHLAFKVGDLRSTMRALADAGRPALDERPRPGADGNEVTFLHPRSAMGVLVELCSPAREDG